VVLLKNSSSIAYSDQEYFKNIYLEVDPLQRRVSWLAVVELFA
jgi:hypothetical protein